MSFHIVRVIVKFCNTVTLHENLVSVVFEPASSCPPEPLEWTSCTLLFTSYLLRIMMTGMMAWAKRSRVYEYMNMTDGFGATLWQLLGLLYSRCALDWGHVSGCGMLKWPNIPWQCLFTSHQGRYPVTHQCTLWLHICLFFTQLTHKTSLWYYIKCRWRN